MDPRERPAPAGARPDRQAPRFWLRGIRYASCWEDAAVVAEGLAPLAGARCLSVASGGDNTFSLLARRPESVLAVDVNPAQLALVELKAAAFAALPHADLVRFLGATGAPRRSDPLGPWRLRTYATTLRPRLGARARALWDAQTRRLATGVVHSGRLEGYFQLFRRVVLPLAHRRATVDALLAPMDPAARERFYEEVWDTPRWRLLARLFFGREAMGRLGRDPACFRHVDRPVGPAILARARHALSTQPAHANPYLRYILTGGFEPLLPDYLRPEHHEPIRDGLSRLTLREATLEAVLPGLAAASLDAFNLSDVGEYVSPAAFHALLREVRRTASRGARIAWWNLLAPREHPADLDASLEVRAADSAALHERAQAFFYSRFVLEVAR
jgi:S-adenosylmethionine-diacylglycerol 3-amino-3-carboxypropyl transferase